MRFKTIALISTLALPFEAHAWGDAGHKVVCEIALSLVSPNARAEIDRLVKVDGEFTSFSDACSWPDHPRKRAAEHFVNVSRDATGLTSPCGDEPACVVSAIGRDFAILSLKASSDSEKAASLKYLGHWVGDVHQPLHVSFRDDRGGNGIKTFGACGSSNLHSVWDTCLVNAAVDGDWHAKAMELLNSISPTQVEALTRSGPMEWANESFRITESARTKYCELHGLSCEGPLSSVNIDQSYIRANTPVVREQLKKAGVRLAHLLDQAL